MMKSGDDVRNVARLPLQSKRQVVRIRKRLRRGFGQKCTRGFLDMFDLIGE